MAVVSIRFTVNGMNQEELNVHTQSSTPSLSNWGFLSCFDESSDVDPVSFLMYRKSLRNRQDWEESNWDTHEEYRTEGPKVKKTRENQGTFNEATQEYERDDPKKSKWWKDYVLSNKHCGGTSRKALKFRRRFRMPLEAFRDLCEIAYRDNWFPSHGNVSCTGTLS